MDEEKEEIIQSLDQRIVLTAQKVKEYRNCVASEPFYRNALPMGLSFGLMNYMLMRMFMKRVRYSIVGFGFMTGYITGRYYYSPYCMRKLMFDLNEIGASRSFQRSFSQQEQRDQQDQGQQSKFPTSSDRLFEEDSSWNKFDIFPRSDVNEFNYESNNLEEESETKQSKDAKPRISYDELWERHKAMQENTHMERRNELMQQYQNKIWNEVTLPKTTADEKNI